jgi:PIN domain nuclease of toxin-antitoxin system
MIIAQSLSEKMAVIGKDMIFKEYGIKMIWEF